MKLSNFGDAINFAITREEEAIQGYGNLIDLAKNPGVTKLLQELQEEERNHKKLLQNITKEKIESLAVTDVIDLKISDYLVEEPPSEDMNFQDLLIHAAKKEQKAVELYSNLANKFKEGDLKKLFEFLIEQEKSHKLKLETEYDSHVLEDD